MNKYKVALANVRTYLFLAKASGNNIYRESAKKCLNELKRALKDDKTLTMEFKC